MIEEAASLAIRIESLEAELAARRMAGLETSGRRTESVLGNLTRKTVGLERGLRAVGLGATAAFGILSTGAGSAIRDWQNYNVAITEVRSITGDTKAEFAAMRREVTALSTSIGVDATVAARGLYQTISAGVPKENALTFLATASKLAIAGVTNVDTAVNGLTNAINAFKIPIEDAESVADALFTTVREGKTTVEELSLNMSKASVPAAALGVDYKELLASIIGITKQGTGSAEAFTQVKNALQALANPSKELLKTYEALKVESGAQLIEQEGLVGALEKVRQAYLGNDAALIEAVRSSEAFLGVLSLTGENLDVVEKGLLAIENGAGDMGDAYKTNAETLQVALTSLKSASVGLVEQMEGSFGTIGTFSKLLKEAAEGIAFLSGSGGVPSIGGAFESLVPAVQAKAVEQQLDTLIRKRDELLNLGAVEGRHEQSVESWGVLPELLGIGNAEVDAELAKVTERIGTLQEALAGVNKELESSPDQAFEKERLDYLEGIQKKLEEGVLTQEQYNSSFETGNAYYDRRVQQLNEVTEQESALKEAEKEAAEERAKAARQEADELKARDKQLVKYAALAEDLATTERERLELQQDYVQAALDSGKISDETGQEALANLEEQIRLLDERNAKAAAGGSKKSNGGAGSSKVKSPLSLPELNDPFGPSNQFEYLQEEEDRLKASYDRRREIILETTKLTEQEKLSLLRDTEQEYLELREEFSQAHRELIVDSAADIFGSLAQIAKDTAGEQSDVYKALFATSKAFAIANSIIKIQQGIAEAAAMPWPTNLAAIGSVIAATSQVVGTISGTNYAGAYEHGGVIPAGRFGLVGEAGPELIEGPVRVTSARNTADYFNQGGDRGTPTNITLNIIGNAQVDSIEEKDTGRGKEFTILLKQVKESMVADVRGRKEFSRVLETTYGLGRGK